MAHQPITSILVSATIGVIAAVVTVAIMIPANSSRSEPSEDERAHRAGVDNLDRRVRAVTRTADSTRLQVIEAELEHLRNAREQDRDHERRSDQDDSPLTAEEHRIRLEEEFSGHEQDFQGDVGDPSWSHAATRDLNEGMESLTGELGFSLLHAECRSRFCKATMEWHDYHKAQQTGLQLAERFVPGLNCKQSIWLRDPDQPAQPYTADLYFDCSAQRDGLVQPYDDGNTVRP
jgi:hypothetical protein